jgi:hypothetical protein
MSTQNVTKLGLTPTSEKVDTRLPSLATEADTQPQHPNL